MWTSKYFYLITDDEEIKEVFRNSKINYVLGGDFSQLKDAFVVAEAVYFKAHEIYELSTKNLFLLIISDFPHPELKSSDNILFVKREYFLDNSPFLLEFCRKTALVLNKMRVELESIEDKLFCIAMSSTDILEKNEEYSKLIAVDGLTGLFNHSHMQAKLLEMFEGYKRKKSPFSVAMLDLDYFKKVNDTYGHLKGDEVLVKFAEVIKRAIRKEDFPARYGGEEFVIIFNEDAGTAGEVLERIKRNFSEVEFEKDGEKFNVTFSAGIAEMGDSYQNPQVLLKDADTALYVSKRSGRDRITVAENNVS